MARSILKGSVFLSAVVLLGCVSTGELEVAKGTPSVAVSFPAEEISPEVLLITPTPESAPSTSAIDCSKPQSNARVEVISDKLNYHRGETILVTICNYLPDVIYAPPQGGCSVVTVQRQENLQWIMEAPVPLKKCMALASHPEVN